MDSIGKIIIILACIFLANAVQALTGFAGTTLAMPGLIIMLSLTEAKTIVVTIAFFSCLWMAFQNYQYINKKQCVKITGWMLVGLLLGMELYKRMPMDFLLTLFALVVIAIALKNLLVTKTIRIPEFAAVLILLCSGLLQGMFISGGALLVIYAANVLPDKKEFRATLQPVWCILNAIIMVQNYQSGLYTPQVNKCLLLSIIPVGAAIVIGNILHDKINQKLFLKATYFLLLISGILLLI